MTNKRGISPLIATVLLIGFVIVLGVLFWVFSSGYIKQSLEKGNECNPTDIEQVDISIIETKNNNNDKFEFTLKNEGSLTPAGYWVRLSSGEETKTFTKSKECRPGRECEFTYKYPEGFVRVSQLEIIPIIVADKKACTAVTKSKKAAVI